MSTQTELKIGPNHLESIKTLISAFTSDHLYETQTFKNS